MSDPISRASGDVITFPIEPLRRMMVMNLALYCAATGMALWLWLAGDGTVWLICVALGAAALLHTGVSVVRRPWLARMTPDAVEVTSLYGRVTRLPWDALVAQSMDLSQRFGVVFAAPEAGVTKERFGIASLRMMGAAAAALFHGELERPRPKLEQRLTATAEAMAAGAMAGRGAGATKGIQ